MFGFLKNKLKEAISKFSKKAEEEAKVEPSIEKEEIKVEEPKVEEIVEEKKEEIKEEAEVEEVKEEKIEEKPIGIREEQKKEKKFLGIFKKKEKVEEKKEVIPEETKEVVEEVKDEPKKGFFSKFAEKLTTKKIDNEKFEDLFSDLEMVLLENNVAMEVINKIKDDLKMDLVNIPLKGKIENLIKESLKRSLEEVLQETNFDLIKEIKNKTDKPYIIVFVGINGSGKTTTVAKLAYLLKENNLKPLLVAADTFRAASIHQLEEHANNLKIKMIKHDYGSDPTAVAFDGVKYAKAHELDVVLIDTAGRQHSNKNLIEEMKKITRVINPDLKIFVGESITGNDCVNQVKEFNDAISIDSIILSKVDIDEKGGAAISVSYVSGKPILYIGIGQGYNNLEKFDKNKILLSIGI